MNKNNIRFLVGLLGLVVIGCAVAVFIKGRLATDVPGLVGSPSADAISTSTLPDGDEIVRNGTAGYAFAMPANWYVEQSAGAGLTVYPDYDPANASPADAGCKIEISELAGGSNGDLNSWITNYLHSDPTANVSETSRTNVKAGDASGDGVSGIEWQGNLNGVSTTLVYFAQTATGGVLEFAPSSLAETGAETGSDAGDAPAQDDCSLDLQALLSNLQIE